jgi:hypothetical protein
LNSFTGSPREYRKTSLDFTGCQRASVGPISLGKIFADVSTFELPDVEIGVCRLHRPVRFWGETFNTGTEIRRIFVSPHPFFFPPGMPNENVAPEFCREIPL